MVDSKIPFEVVEWLFARGADTNLKNKEGRTPMMWGLMDRRLWLEAHINFPAWAKERAIHTVIRFHMFSSPEPLRSLQVADFDTPPPISELVRKSAGQAPEGVRGIPARLALVVYRSNKAGGVEQAEKVMLNPSANGVKADLPELRWGDVLVLCAANPDEAFDTREVRTLLIGQTKPNVRKVSVQLGNSRRDVALAGVGLVWAPTTGSLPEWDFSEVVANLVGGEPRAQLSAVKIQREVDGKPKEWTVDLRPEKPNTAVTNIPARLADGDRVIVTLLPENDPGALSIRKTGIYRTAPGRLFGECVFRFSEKDNAPRTLGDLIAESYLMSGMFIPDPDLAHIQIHRLKRDSATEELLEINLMATVQQASVDMPETEARKLDVPLLPGDIVEIAPRKGSEGKEWTGLSNDVKLFLTKALGRSVTFQFGRLQLATKEIRPSFVTFWGGGRSGGTGRSPFRATSVFIPNDWTFKIRLSSGEKVREFTAEEFSKVNPWLVDGDRLEVEQY
jgi:hypothetical protein